MLKVSALYVSLSLLMGCVGSHTIKNPVSFTNSIGMRFVTIGPGNFMMGSRESEKGRSDDEGPQHLVEIKKGFQFGLTEVTQDQWYTVMRTLPWKAGCKRYPGVQYGDNFPALYIDFLRASEFCRRLSKLEGEKYRLPTEAEWEYACRAGTTTRFSFGDGAAKLRNYAWYAENAKEDGTRFTNHYGDEWDGFRESRIHRVGKKEPNPWGLYDMHGSVGEWCSGQYLTYPKNPAPKGVNPPPSPLKLKALRGGNWSSVANCCRCAARNPACVFPCLYVSVAGFRVIREIPRE